MVLSADAVYAQDYGALVEEHMAGDAAVTIVTTEVDPDDADRYGVVQVEGGKVVDYAYKPDDPDGNLVANEVFVFRPEPLLETLEQLADEAGEDGLEDLGHGLLPRLVEAGGARESRFDGYWRDVGTVDAYWESHQDLLARPAADRPRRPRLADPHPRRPAARVRARGAAPSIEDSLVAPAARVAGEVSRSVIGRGAVVEAGAVVRESVLLPGAVVRVGRARGARGARRRASRSGADAAVGSEGGEIALVGLRASVSAAPSRPAAGSPRWRTTRTSTAAGWGSGESSRGGDPSAGALTSTYSTVEGARRPPDAAGIAASPPSRS